MSHTVNRVGEFLTECQTCAAVGVGVATSLFCAVQPETWVAAGILASAAANPEATPAVVAVGCGIAGAAVGAGLSPYGP